MQLCIPPNGNRIVGPIGLCGGQCNFSDFFKAFVKDVILCIIFKYPITIERIKPSFLCLNSVYMCQWLSGHSSALFPALGVEYGP